MPPKPYGRGTAERRWRDIFKFLQTKYPPVTALPRQPPLGKGAFCLCTNLNATALFLHIYSVRKNVIINDKSGIV